jgi:pyruvate formate lyase activating enzyme
VRAPAATIFDVQRFSVHDGPGIRTVVFFKGCSLRCRWCQNPEGIRPAPELAYFEDRCLAGCAACLTACEKRALGPSRAGRVAFDRCSACGDCLPPCPSGALRIAGREVGTGELLAEVLRDQTFYRSSGGGLTLSGGEPVLQSEFLQAFLPAAKNAGLHVVLETAGHYPFSLLEPLLPHLDLVLFDL